MKSEDVVNVRIYQGIHFRSADEVARRQGHALRIGLSPTFCGVEAPDDTVCEAHRESKRPAAARNAAGCDEAGPSAR